LKYKSKWRCNTEYGSAFQIFITRTENEKFSNVKSRIGFIQFTWMAMESWLWKSKASIVVNIRPAKSSALSRWHPQFNLVTRSPAQSQLSPADDECHCLPQLFMLLVSDFMHCYSYAKFWYNSEARRDFFTVLVIYLFVAWIAVARYTNLETGFDIHRIWFLILYDDTKRTYMTSVWIHVGGNRRTLELSLGGWKYCIQSSRKLL